jgi:hypothetical protein
MNSIPTTLAPLVSHNPNRRMTAMKTVKPKASAITAKALELRSTPTPSGAIRSSRSRCSKALSAFILILGLVALGRGAYSQPGNFAVIMAPKDQQGSWWYYGETADDLGKLLKQNKARLTEITPHIDSDGVLKFDVIMVPDDQQGWWWYWGETAHDVNKLLKQNSAMPTQNSPYIDGNGALKFAVIMAPNNDQQKRWWYYGETGNDVGKLITENKARLTQLTPYIDGNGALKFVVIMAPDDQQGWWWYWGKTGDDVNNLLTQNKAMLTQVTPYYEANGSVKFAVLMAPDNGQQQWWYSGQTADDVSNLLSENNARLIGLALVSGAATPSQLGSYANYIFGNNDCKLLKDIQVTIEITEDLVVSSTVTSGGEPTSKGFAFQLNANSSAMPKSNPKINANNWIVWQQYIFGVGSVIQGAINNWTAPSLSTGNQTVNSPAVQVGPTLAQIGKLPKGYKLTFALTTDKNTGNVTAVTYEVYDGRILYPTQTLVLTDVGATPPEVAPIVDFELNLVGPGDLDHTKFLSGAGKITYSASTDLNALPSIPGCAGSNTTTGETSNSVYGLVPAGGYKSFVQSFSVSK